MLKMKQRDFTSHNRCNIQRKRNLLLESGKALEKRYAESVFIKSTIKDILTGRKNLSEAELHEMAETAYAEIDYLSPETRRIKAKEAVIQILRYINAEERTPDRHPGKKNVNLFDKIEVETLPDLIFSGKKTIKKSVGKGKAKETIEETFDYIEAVKICCRRPNVTNTGRSKDTNAQHNLELYSMLEYVKSLIPEERKEKMLIGASFYFTMTKNDKTSEGMWEEDFFNGKGAGNIVGLWDEYFPGIPSELDVAFALEVDDWIKGEERCSNEICKKCRFNATCNFNLPPKRAAVAESAKVLSAINLTPEQEAAIGFRKGIADINAGAGAGKTLVVALRVAFMIMEGCPVKDILCITFTKDGAKEMKERISLYLKDMGWTGDLDDLQVMTFNSFGDIIVRKEYKQFGFEKEPRLVQDIERLSIIADLLNERVIDGLDYRNFNIAEKNCRGAVAVASDFCHQAKANMVSGINESTILMLEDKIGGTLTEDLAKDLFDLYIRFNNRLTENNLMEYADQEILVLGLLHNNPYYFEDAGNTFRHIIVDEFQDTNEVQFEILKYLIDTPAKESFMVVGDDSQAIYGFRGATSDLLVNFEENIKENVTHFYLLDNHRSTPQIIDFANKLNALNVKRVEKDLKASRPSGRTVEVMSFWKEDELLKETVEIIKRELDKGARYEDIACLDRQRSDLLKLGTALTENGIPWIMLSPEPSLENSRVKAAIAFNNAVIDPTATKDIFEYLNAACGNRVLDKTDEEIEVLIDQFVEFIPEIRKKGEKEFAEWFTTCLQVLDDEDEIYEDFLEQVFFYKTYDGMSKFLTDFNTFGQRQTAKRKLRYPGVVLTTAHSSKGLEWPVIINDVTKYHNKALNQDDMEAERRLFFVSATRARNKLYVLGKKAAYGNKKEGTRKFNQFLQDTYNILGEEMDLCETS